MFHETLDSSTLAGGIAAFKHNDDALACFLDPDLELE